MVVADSLSFYGPEGGVLLTDARLYPNVAAAQLEASTGERWHADTVARIGWTARDAWWALTRDPWVYSVGLPRADVVLLAVGSMDALPASIPTYLREGIRYVRPAGLRATVRQGYHRTHPYVARALRGRVRVLPQSVTDHYLSRCVAGIRHFHPEVPILGVVPTPTYAASYGYVTAGEPAAQEAARSWGHREGVSLVELPRLVAPSLAAGTANPDGIHWNWDVHAAVGGEVARMAQQALGNR